MAAGFVEVACVFVKPKAGKFFFRTVLLITCILLTRCSWGNKQATEIERLM